MKNKDKILRIIHKDGCRSEISEEKAVVFTKSGRTSLTVRFGRVMTCFLSVNGEGEYRKHVGFEGVRHHLEWFLFHSPRIDMLHEIVIPPESTVEHLCGFIEIHTGRIVLTVEVGNPEFWASSKVRITENCGEYVPLCFSVLDKDPNKALAEVIKKSNLKMDEIYKNSVSAEKSMIYLNSFVENGEYNDAA